MDQAGYHALRNRALWHVVSCDTTERLPPRAPWWFENHGRGPGGLVVFQVLLAGRCILRTAGGDLPVERGQAFLFAYEEPTAYGRPADRPEWPGWGDDLRTAHVAFAGAGLREHWDALRASTGPVVSLGDGTRCAERIARLERRLDRMRADRRAASPEVHAFVMSLFDEIEAAAAEGLGPVERAVDELLRAPLVGHALKDVARRHGCTREHLTRVFTERVGLPPARWLRRERLQRALELLRATDLPLATVAAQAGFASPRTLARLVRRDAGSAPGTLRPARRRR